MSAEVWTCETGDSKPCSAADGADGTFGSTCETQKLSQRSLALRLACTQHVLCLRSTTVMLQEERQPSVRKKHATHYWERHMWQTGRKPSATYLHEQETQEN